MTKIERVTLAALALLTLGSCATSDRVSAICRASEQSMHPIVSTHTPMPYPPISARLSEQGVTMMTVIIGYDGAPTEVTLIKSSGSERLDTAAISYIKAYWRWQSPTEGCIPAMAAVNVAWHISDPPVPISGLKVQRGVETMTIYTIRLHIMASMRQRMTKIDTTFSPALKAP